MAALANAVLVIIFAAALVFIGHIVGELFGHPIVGAVVIPIVGGLYVWARTVIERGGA